LNKKNRRRNKNELAKTNKDEKERKKTKYEVKNEKFRITKD
jgi:hypothetical protein